MLFFASRRRLGAAESIPSSDPISNTTQEVPTAITRRRQGQALLHSYNQGGAEISEACAAPCTPTRSDLGTSAMNVDVDINETQAAIQLADKKRKNDEVSKELMAVFVQMAVDNVMKRIDPQRQSVVEEVNGSVERAFDKAVKVLTTDLHDRMTKWETQMSSQTQSRCERKYSSTSKRTGETVEFSDGKRGQDHAEQI